jgi:hypothetical protein
MEFNRLESAKFAIAADETLTKLTDGVEKALAEDAGRGFPAPGGDTLAAILAAGQEAKGKLGELNAKIYEERRGLIFQSEEFEMGFIVKVSRLAMELYREEIFNALALEQAEADALRETNRADVARMNTETEKRTVAIMQNRAEAERRITIYKQALVTAETTTLGAEATLIQAQLSTAEKKLEIIDSIYRVLAAEQLVLAAEQRRADSLTKVLAAEQLVAAIKKEMIPFYVSKAEARQELAEATQAEIPVLKAIEELGYDRIALKDAQEGFQHQEREADLDLIMAQESYTRANSAAEIARQQSRRLLREYANQIQGLILDQKKELQKSEVDFKLDTGLAREAIGVNNEVAVVGHERGNILTELSSLLVNMESRALDQNLTVKASGTRASTSIVDRTSSRVSNRTDDLMRQIVVGVF